MLRPSTSPVRQDLNAHLKTRPARLDDLPEIVGLDPDLHGGLDQLPALFPTLFEDPHIRAQVCHLEGKMVAFQMAHVVDDGETVIHQSLRVHKDLRSRGLWPIVRKRLYQILTDFRQIKTLALTTAVKEIHMKRIKNHPENNIRYIMERPNIRVRPTVSELQHLTQSLTNLPLSLQSQNRPIIAEGQKALDILMNKTNQRTLFPQGRIISSWEPYKLKYSNFCSILDPSKGSAAMFVTPLVKNSSASESKTGSTDILETRTGSETCLVSSASLGKALVVPAGIRYDLEYYGDDIQDTLSHIAMHLLNCSTAGKINFEVFVPDTLDKEGLKTKIESELGLTCEKQGLVCHLFERPYLPANL